MTPLAHYTARALPGRYPFADTALARDFWRRLRRGFPEALSVALMPNHVHMVAPDRGLQGARGLGRLLAGTARASERWSGRGAWWEPVQRPEVLTSRDKVRRVVRYAWLNPCRPWSYRSHRLRLADDPLAWSWSTLRDSIGAVVDPWVPAERLAVAFGWPRGGDLRERLHGYAVRDEDVVVEARVFPRRPSSREAPVGSLEEILRAALAATRSPREALRARSVARRVAIGLCYRQGWSHPAQLAPIFDVHPNTVCRIARSASNEEVEAAALCLDARLQLDPDANMRAAGVEPF